MQICPAGVRTSSRSLSVLRTMAVLLRLRATRRSAADRVLAPLHTSAIPTRLPIRLQRSATMDSGIAQTAIITDTITLKLDDTPGIGGFTLEVNPPAVAVPVKLVCNTSGVEITCGAASVKLTPVSVSLNNGALEVI